MTIRGISSMATRQLLEQLAHDYSVATGEAVEFESVGGVDAARRVRDGEPFDLVVLAADVIDALSAEGRVQPGSRTDLVLSGVEVAVRAGAPRPPIDSVESLRASLLAAASIGYSTGPSGVALLALFDRWGLTGQLRDRLVQAKPGVPVGALVADGTVELGFQQLSELINLPGIDLIGPLPPQVQIITTFSGGVCSAARDPAGAGRLLRFLAGPDTVEAKRRHGMEPA